LSLFHDETSTNRKTFRDHRDHRSGHRDQLITITPEQLIIFIPES
jgi:hypothetical protein